MSQEPLVLTLEEAMVLCHNKEREMTELLKRWHEHEPSRCLIGAPTSHICAEVILGGRLHPVHFDKHKRVAAQEALLLAAVIEAIEARDAKAVKHNAGEGQEHDLHEWRYSLGGHSEGTWAEVWFGWPLTVGRSYRAESQQPAEALLAAYLDAVAALEAEEQE